MDYTSFLILVLASGLSEPAANVGIPDQYDFLSDVDNLSDESTDIQVQPENDTDSIPDEPPQEEEEEEQPPSVLEDPKVYGMNIGLHFLLEGINARLIQGERVHLESLIKVLVLTHQIEKVGGSVNDSNKMALKKVSSLYPRALKTAMADS